MNMHETLSHTRITENFEEMYSRFSESYQLPE